MLQQLSRYKMPPLHLSGSVNCGRDDDTASSLGLLFASWFLPVNIILSFQFASSLHIVNIIS